MWCIGCAKLVYTLIQWYCAISFTFKRCYLNYKKRKEQNKLCYIRACIFITFSQLPTLQLYCFSPSIQKNSISSFSFFNRRYQIFLISYFLLFVRTRRTRLSINNRRYDLRTILKEDYASVGLRHYQRVKHGYRHGHRTQHRH